jgi:surface polysaccharide O-acyltransferase-like enzyme
MAENFNIVESSKILSSIDTSMKIKKVRNYGVDVVRILAMYGIVFNHLYNKKKILIKYQRYKGLKLFHIFFFWHNNGFAFISGFIGYKTHKYSNLLYLWACVSFYSVIIYLSYLKINPQVIMDEKLYHNLFPIIFERYWFFTAYFGMYLYLPIVNKGIAYLSKLKLKICIISIITLLVFWHDLMNLKSDVFKLNQGLSVLWLLTFFITGSYFGKYKINYLGIKKYIFCFMNFLIFISSSFLYYKIYHYGINDIKENKFALTLKNILTENYDSNLKVVQSISIILLLLQINYNDNLGKIISFIGIKTFGVYLLHDNKYIRVNIIIHLLDNEKNNISLFLVFKIFLTKSILIFVVCITIDYFRNYLFNLLKIKKFCIFFEKRFIESKIN